MTTTQKNERRDWTLLIFIIPIGILLILFVGQLAVRLVPFWSVNVGMNSNLEPDVDSARPFALLEPILPQILTPMAWAETYLTPGAEISFPPFLTFEPSATPSPTAATATPTDTTPTQPPAATTTTPVQTGTSTTPVVVVPTDGTPPPDDNATPPPTTCQDPAASNFGGPLPCTYPPTTCQDPAASNFGGPLPCTYPPTTCQDPAASNFGGPLPCTYPPTTCQDPAASNFGGPLPCTYPPTTCQDPAASNFGGPLPCTYPPTTCQDPAASNFGGPLPCTYPPTTCQDPAASNFGGPLPCTYPPTTCQDPAASNFGGPLPCTYPPTTCQDPAASNFGGPLPCTYPPTTCQDNTASNVGDPLPCVYGSVNPIDPSKQVDPAPAAIGVNEPPNNSIGTIAEGYYVVINVSVVVEPTPDNNYDLAFYEYLNGTNVYMDWIVIGITNDESGASYYEVFNWGEDPTPDMNSNVGGVAGSEDDDQEIPTGVLYDPDDGGPLPESGILIDVDTAASNPTPGTYNYVVIVSPVGGFTNNPVQIDSVQAVEVPTPTPTP